MDESQMQTLVDSHLRAEEQGDIDGAVAVYTDALSATVLSALPGLELDPAAVQRVIDAPDPVEAGLAAALAEAQALLAIPGVAGVNLSGLASGRGYDYAAQVKADCATRIREVRPA